MTCLALSTAVTTCCWCWNQAKYYPSDPETNKKLTCHNVYSSVYKGSKINPEVIFTSCDRKGRSWAMIAFKRLAISICKNIYYFDFWMQWQFRVFNEWLIKNLIRFWHMLRLKALNKLRQFSNILNDFRHLQILRVFKGYLITFSHFNKTLYFTCLCISTLRP